MCTVAQFWENNSLGRLTVNVSNSKCNLLPQLLLIKLHPDDLVGEPLMEKPVDLGAATQLQCVHIPTSASLNRPLKVIL